MTTGLADLRAEMIPPGSARPAIDRDELLRRRTRHILRRELELLAHAAARPFRGEADAIDEQHPPATAGFHTAQA